MRPRLSYSSGALRTNPMALCQCGNRKPVWALGCRDCWAALPQSLRMRIEDKTLPLENRRAAVRVALEKFNANRGR
jgi:hypothetical protein